MRAPDRLFQRRRLLLWALVAAAGLASQVVSGGAAVANQAHRGAASSPLGWSVAPTPFRLSFVAGGHPLTAETPGPPGPAGRLSYALENGSVHTVTHLVGSAAVPHGTRYDVATDEPGRVATVTVTRSSRALRVDWKLLPTQGVAAVFEALSATPAEHFLGTGESSAVDLRGRVASLQVAYSCGVEFPVPFFLSGAGYGFLAPTQAVGSMAFPGAGATASACSAGPEAACPLAPRADRTEICFKKQSLSYEVYAGTPAQIMDAYTAAAGRPAHAPLSEFGAQKWRGVWAEDTAANVLGDVQRYAQLKIPLTWIHINDPWEVSTCWGTLRYDDNRFPDPAGLVAKVHKLGIKVMLWVSPYVNPNPECPPTGYALQDLIGSGNRRKLIDLTDPAAYALFQRKLRDAFAAGVDGIKGDRGDELDLAGEHLHAGAGAKLQNAYPYVFAKAVTEVLQRLHGADFGTIFRAGSLGSQKLLPGIFLSDHADTYEGLREVIRAGLSAGASGFPVWGSDIGGYANTNPSSDGELFVRWAQFGSVSPVFEVGGLGRNSHFWEFGDRVVGLFRAASILHYELAPYLYDLSRRASATGTPIVRPLGFQYPHDPSAWTNELEFTVGPSLLAAPVTSPGTQARVYLPAGSWIDLFTGEVVRGGGTITRPTPLSEFPLYLQVGSAIPFNLRDPDVWSSPWGLSDLQRAGRAGWLLAPHVGRTTASAYGAGTLTSRLSGTKLTITLSGSPREVQVLVMLRRPPVTVAIDGGAPSAAVSVARLRASSSGWTSRPAPVRGALLKFRTTGGRATAVISLR